MSHVQDLEATKRDLISANHILHYHGVVDAFGHVSVRHPSDPSIYIMAAYMAPALVKSAEDLVEYHVSDSEPVSPAAAKGYSERFIHGEIFRRFPHVSCVVHSHAQQVLPYVVADVLLQPVYHMAGFLGERVPVFDIEPLYREEDEQNMLVDNQRFGQALASKFDSATADSPTGSPPDHPVVLMRRHGFTVVGPDLTSAVYRAIYTTINADVQTKTLGLVRSYRSDKPGGQVLGEDSHILTTKQRKGCSRVTQQYQDKPWRLWLHEVDTSKMYTNLLRPS